MLLRVGEAQSIGRGLLRRNLLGFAVTDTPHIAVDDCVNGEHLGVIRPFLGLGVIARRGSKLALAPLLQPAIGFDDTLLIKREQNNRSTESEDENQRQQREGTTGMKPLGRLYQSTPPGSGHGCGNRQLAGINSHEMADSGN